MFSTVPAYWTGTTWQLLTSPADILGSREAAQWSALDHVVDLGVVEQLVFAGPQTRFADCLGALWDHQARADGVGSDAMPAVFACHGARQGQ